MIPFDAIDKRYTQVSEQLTDPSLDHAKRPELQRELSHLETLRTFGTELAEMDEQLAATQQALDVEVDAEMKALYQDELAELSQRRTERIQELENLMAPPSPHDDRSVYLEIRAGAGGQEASLFAANLLRMYTNYALSKGWKVNVEHTSQTDLGGYREVVLHIQGKNVYGTLKRESGVHRVQRVPSTETQGRVHTSTATVAVLPEAKEVDVKIDPSDLRIDVYRASGAGGQHVNTTDSAVRITHVPTGVVVSCQDERSQHKNKARALKVLQSRILAAQMEAHEAEQSKNRKQQVGAGMRSEKVRTYNFPQNRVTDHQVNMTLKKLDMVIEGDLEEIMTALQQDDREQRKKEFLSTLHA